MTEEQVTKALLVWLNINKWKVISYDFPQSGTGVPLHPNVDIRSGKNLGSIIPDIVAIKDGIVIFSENKDRFVRSDFEKINRLRSTDDYAQALSRLLANHSYSQILYGVGLPQTKLIEKRIAEYDERIDFALLVSLDRSTVSPISAHTIFT